MIAFEALRLFYLAAFASQEAAIANLLKQLNHAELNRSKKVQRIPAFTGTGHNVVLWGIGASTLQSGRKRRFTKNVRLKAQLALIPFQS